MKPRLLILLNRLSIGGPAANTLALAAELSSEFDILLVAGEPLPDEQSAAHLLEQYKGFAVEIVPQFRRAVVPWQDAKTYKVIRKIIQRFQPHIVHTHGSKPGVLGRLAAWRLQVPVIVHTYHGHVFHSYFSKWTSGAIVLLERWLASHTNLIIAINDKLRYELEQVYKVASSDKIIVNRLGIEWEKLQDTNGSLRREFRSEFQLNETEVAVAIIGRLVPVKQHSLFLAIAEQLLQYETVHYRFKFLIVGDGEERKLLMQKIQHRKGDTSHTSTNNNPDFIFTSWRTDISRVMAGIDILLLTSLNEGTPVSILEAMAAGKPVVATPVGGIPELFQQAGTGFAAADKQQLVEKILFLAETPDERAAWGQKGTAFIKHNLSISYQADSLVKVFMSALSKS